MSSETKDPCAVLAELRKKRQKIITSGSVTKTRFRSASGSERETSRSKVDMTALDAEIRKYEDLCSQSMGGRGRRFAATAG